MFAKVYLEISNICNLSCSFCALTKRDKRKLNVEEFNFLANKLRSHSEYLYFHVMGEPLMHPNLQEFLQIADDLKFKVIITTNATLLDKQSEILLNAKALHKVNISLHSLEANSGFFMPEYIESCANFAKKMNEKNKLCCLRLWNLGDGLNDENDNILNTLHKVFITDWKDTRSGFKLAQKVYLEWGEKFDWPSLDAKDFGENCFCYGLRDQIAVLCDGTVVPCCLDHEGDINLGNLFFEELDDILQKPKTKAIYNGFTQRKAIEKLCRRCGYARRFK